MGEIMVIVFAGQKVETEVEIGETGCHDGCREEHEVLAASATTGCRQVDGGAGERVGERCGH